MCFGLPAYWINPQIARKLLEACMPLQVEKNGMTRGIPEHVLVTLDGMLNNRYKDHQRKSNNTSTGPGAQQSTNIANKGRNIRQFPKLNSSAKTLHTIQLLGKHIANNCNNRSRTQFNISRNTHSTLKVQLLLSGNTDCSSSLTVAGNRYA